MNIIVDQGIKFDVIKQKNIIVIKSDKFNNPSDYSINIFNFLKKSNLLKNKNIYLDMSDAYSIYSKHWIYQWDFITDNNTDLIDEKIKSINNLKEVDQKDYSFFYNYIENKAKHNIN